MVAGGSCADNDVPNVRSISDTDAYGGEGDDDGEDTPIMEEGPPPANPNVNLERLKEEEKEIVKEVASESCSQKKKIKEYFEGLKCRMDEQQAWLQVKGLYSETNACSTRMDSIIDALHDEDRDDISDGWLINRCTTFAGKALENVKTDKEKWEKDKDKKSRKKQVTDELTRMLGSGNPLDSESYDLEGVLLRSLRNLNGACAGSIILGEIDKAIGDIKIGTSTSVTNKEGKAIERAYLTYYYTPFRQDTHKSSQHWIPLIMRYARPTADTSTSSIAQVLSDLQGTTIGDNSSVNLQLPSTTPPNDLTIIGNSTVFPVRKLKISCNRPTDPNDSDYRNDYRYLSDTGDDAVENNDFFLFKDFKYPAVTDNVSCVPRPQGADGDLNVLAAVMPVTKDETFDIKSGSVGAVKCAREKKWQVTAPPAPTGSPGGFTRKIACGFKQTTLLDSPQNCFERPAGDNTKKIGYHMIAYNSQDRSFLEPRNDHVANLDNGTSHCNNVDKWKWFEFAHGSGLESTSYHDSCIEYSDGATKNNNPITIGPVRIHPTKPKCYQLHSGDKESITGYNKVYSLGYYVVGSDLSDRQILTPISKLNDENLSDNLNLGSPEGHRADDPDTTIFTKVIPDASTTSCEEGIHYFDLCNTGTQSNKFNTTSNLNIKDWYDRLCVTVTD